MAKLLGRILRIEGRVQGVGFRYFTRDAACNSGVSGFVCNKNDGSVYVEAYGESVKLDDFITYITEKGRCGVVLNVTVETVSFDPKYTDFEIKQDYEY